MVYPGKTPDYQPSKHVSHKESKITVSTRIFLLHLRLGSDGKMFKVLLYCFLS